MANQVRFIESSRACNCGCDEGFSIVSDKGDVLLFMYDCGYKKVLYETDINDGFLVLGDCRYEKRAPK